MWFLQIVRSFFFTLDSTLFNLIPKVYDLLITISRTSILTQGQIKVFSDRIQALLGVFMLFKVTFSLITYIINPDDFSEKSKGFGKLWQNVIISFIILILTPYAFSMAYDLQAMILEDNTLAALVFGDNQTDYNYINTAGEQMAYTIMEPFFSPNTSLRSGTVGLTECTKLYETDEYGKKTFNQECKSAMEEIMDENSTSSTSYLNNYVAGVENSNLGLFFRLEMAKKTVVVESDEEFLIDYMVPVSTVVVVIVLLLLITFCLDIALRSVKLAFLQLISPIPIISYIDPKSGKDGLFKKWYQMCFSTYLSLFVRLLALYLAVYIISLINSMTDVVTGAEVSNPWIKIFIIIGVLMFAKQLPKILEGFGIKLDGDGKFTLNPFKKIEDQAFGGKQIIGGAKGLATGAAIGTVGAFSGAGFGRGLSGAIGGLKAGISGKKAGEIRKDQAHRNMEMRRALDNGSTFWGRRGAQLSSFVGAPGELGVIASQKSAIEYQQKQFDNQVKALEDEKKSVQRSMEPTQSNITKQKSFADALKAMETRAKDEIAAGHGGDIGKEYLRRKAEFERLKSGGIINGHAATANDIANAELEMNNYLNDVGMKQYMTQATSGRFSDGSNDATFQSMRASAEQVGATVGVTLGNTGDAIHAAYGAAKGQIGNLERSIFDQQQHINSLDSQITNINGQRAELGTQMRDLETREETAKANMDAVHGEGGGPGGRGPGGFGPRQPRP